MVECKYRGRVIGWLVTGADGFLRYSPNHGVITLGGVTRWSSDGGLTWYEDSRQWTTT